MQRQRPDSVLVLAILHFVGGGLGLLLVVCSGALQLAGVGQTDNPALQAYEKHLNDNLPSNTTLAAASTVFDVLLSVVLLAAGVGLLGMHAWGRTLSFAYALLSILHKVVGLVYSMAFILPLTNDFVSIHAVKSAEEELFMNAVKYGVVLSLVWTLLTLIYPMVVLIVLNRGTVEAAFRGELPEGDAESEAEAYR